MVCAPNFTLNCLLVPIRVTRLTVTNNLCLIIVIQNRIASADCTFAHWLTDVEHVHTRAGQPPRGHGHVDYLYHILRAHDLCVRGGESACGVSSPRTHNISFRFYDLHNFNVVKFRLGVAGPVEDRVSPSSPAQVSNVRTRISRTECL